ncbi:hypothetical protein BGZ79_009619 [Entomortierella chlamydospora]|nr:hypothetical protein BGZ79_009619 [Entomortierella chlamydospora]
MLKSKRGDNVYGRDPWVSGHLEGNIRASSSTVTSIRKAKRGANQEESNFKRQGNSNPPSISSTTTIRTTMKRKAKRGRSQFEIRIEERSSKNLTSAPQKREIDLRETVIKERDNIDPLSVPSTIATDPKTSREADLDKINTKGEAKGSHPSIPLAIPTKRRLQHGVDQDEADLEKQDNRNLLSTPSEITTIRRSKRGMKQDETNIEEQGCCNTPLIPSTTTVKQSAKGVADRDKTDIEERDNSNPLVIAIPPIIKMRRRSIRGAYWKTPSTEEQENSLFSIPSTSNITRKTGRVINQGTSGIGIQDGNSLPPTPSTTTPMQKSKRRANQDRTVMEKLGRNNPPPIHSALVMTRKSKRGVRQNGTDIEEQVISKSPTVPSSIAMKRISKRGASRGEVATQEQEQDSSKLPLAPSTNRMTRRSMRGKPRDEIDVEEQDNSNLPTISSTSIRQRKAKRGTKQSETNAEDLDDSIFQLRINDYNPDNPSPKSFEDLLRVFRHVDKQAPSVSKAPWTRLHKTHIRQAFTTNIIELRKATSANERGLLLLQLEKAIETYVEDHVVKDHEKWAKLIMQIIAVTYVRQGDQFVYLRNEARRRLYKLSPLQPEGKDSSQMRVVLTGIENQLDDLEGNVAGTRIGVDTHFLVMESGIHILDHILEERRESLLMKIDHMAAQQEALFKLNNGSSILETCNNEEAIPLERTRSSDRSTPSDGVVPLERGGPSEDSMLLEKRPSLARSNRSSSAPRTKGTKRLKRLYEDSDEEKYETSISTRGVRKWKNFPLDTNAYINQWASMVKVPLKAIEISPGVECLSYPCDAKKLPAMDIEAFIFFGPVNMKRKEPEGDVDSFQIPFVSQVSVGPGHALDSCGSLTFLNIVLNCPRVLEKSPLSLRELALEVAEAPTIKHAWRCFDKSEIANTIHNAHSVIVQEADGVSTKNVFSKTPYAKRKKQAENQDALDAMTATMEDEKNPLGHFTALMPINGFVWELDSLQTEPIKIGRVPKDADWKHFAFEYANSLMSGLPQYDRKYLTKLIAIVGTV